MTSSAARGAGLPQFVKGTSRKYDLCRRLPLGQFQDYVVCALRGKFSGWSRMVRGSDQLPVIPLRMKSCPSIHLKAGMGLPDFQTSNEATGVEAASRFSAGFGIYDNWTGMQTPILFIPSTKYLSQFAVFKTLFLGEMSTISLPTEMQMGSLTVSLSPVLSGKEPWDVPQVRGIFGFNPKSNGKVPGKSIFSNHHRIIIIIIIIIIESKK